MMTKLITAANTAKPAPSPLSAVMLIHCPRTARKCLARCRAEGRAGLTDRSSRPRKLRRPTTAETVKRIIALRRERWTGKHIACETGVSPATASRVLKRAGLFSRLGKNRDNLMRSHN